MRRGRQSAFWLHLLRCSPTAEQLTPATADQPCALKGQAPQLGSPSNRWHASGGRVLGRPVAVSQIKPRQAATRVFGHLDRRDESAAFFFFHREQSREWYNCFPAVSRFRHPEGDERSHVAECLCGDVKLKWICLSQQRFQGLWIACLWWCDGRWKTPSYHFHSKIIFIQ